jgi:hypothetical protein
MTVYFWLVMLGFAAMIVGTIWYVRRKAGERRLAEEARVAAFMNGLANAPKPAPVNAPSAAATVAPAPAPAPANDLALQKLLFEAARKAGEAGEPALAIQLYARLLARFPATGFAEPARAAVVVLKKAVKG